MRISSFATLLGLSFVACTVGDTGGGGGDDDTPPGCGNNTMDTGEQCDDGNTNSGDGCSSSCQFEAAPRLDMSIDKSTVATELHSTSMLTITLTGSEGFTGDVTLAPSVVDAAGAPLTGWTVALDKTTVTLPTNGTGVAVATLTIPGDATLLTGSVKITATTAVPRAMVATPAVTSSVTAAQQVTFVTKLDGNGACMLPTINLAVKVGTTIKFVADSTNTKNVTIHSNGGAGIKHEPDPGSAPGTAYAQTTASAGTAQLYCHDPATPNGPLQQQWKVTASN